ncbi:MAG: hypothetical protein IKU17_01280 [Clostridia bacterium]|nr:hypothetical protein [Clostridia bacterium]
MKKHGRKMIAPVIIAVLFALYYAGFAAACLFIPTPLWLRLLMGGGPLALAGVCVYVLVQRIHEIRSGEEDDLADY